MKHNIESDQRRRKLFYLNEHKLRAYKIVKLMAKQNNNSVDLTTCEVTSGNLKLKNDHSIPQIFPRNASLTRIRNRCALTGRSRGVYRFFKLSRLCIRELFGKGYLPGIRKY